MNVSLNWLKRYVDFDIGADELARGLTERLTETEVVEVPWRGVDGVVAARVVTAEPHPDAAKLSVCVVDWGAGSSTVVCGAPNVRAGMMSVFAPPGAVIRGGLKVGEQTIRGRRSHGMLVSAAELGLEETSEGILELTDGIEPGSDLGPTLGLDDEVIDLDVQPNRPDCLGILGVAREVAALLEAEFRIPRFELEESGGASGEMVEVVLDDPAGCPRYIARVISDLEVGPAPLWMSACLRGVGVRSISNIVDVTNFVMLEYGHPIHAFDYDRLSEHRIIVRRASEGESLTTLDDVERKLTAEHLLICDGERPVALAGIMGGADSEVGPGTTKVLLECAWFDPAVVRRGAKKLGLSTEASQRFEHGVDPKAMPEVAARACALMSEYAGGAVARGAVDAGMDGGDGPVISLRLEKVTSMLGRDVARADVLTSLLGLGFRVDDGDAADRLIVGVPTHRRDVEVEADLIEEVIRAYGYDRIPPEVPFHTVEAPIGTGDRARSAARVALVSLGFYEVLTTSFMSRRAAETMGSESAGDPIELDSPVNKEMPLLRTSLVPSILDVIRHNRNVGEKDLRLFEIGKIFSSGDRGPEERWSLAGAMAGLSSRSFWGDDLRRLDFYDLKGVLWALAEALDIDTPEGACYDGALFEPGAGARLSYGGRDVGAFGLFARRILNEWEIPDPVMGFVLDLDTLCELCEQVPVFDELPRYPKIRRDIALVLDDHVAAGDVVSLVRSHEEPLLADVEVFDVYRGEQLPGGKKSLGFGLTYMSRERTLTDAEIDEVHGRIVDSVLARFKAALRE